jgi:hypothetical protein
MPPRRPREVIRFAASTAAALGCLLPILFFGAALTFAGARFGWLPAAVLLGGAGAAVASATAPRSASAVWRRRAIGAVGLAASVVGVASAHLAPPSAGRLRDEGNRLVPGDWHLVADRSSGNSLCFDECPRATRTYMAETHMHETADALRESIPDMACGPRFNTRHECSVRRGDVEAEFHFVAGAAGGTEITVHLRGR